MSAKKPQNNNVYSQIVKAMRELKAQIEKTSKTQHGNKAVSVDSMMIEARRVCAEHGLYLEMSEHKFQKDESRDSLLVFVTYQFRWIWEGEPIGDDMVTHVSEPELCTVVARLAKSTDSGAMRAYGWKYYIRQSLMIATGDEDLDSLVRPIDDDSPKKNAQLEREIEEENILVARRNTVQTRLINTGFAKDFPHVLDWIVGSIGNQIASINQYQLTIAEKWLDMVNGQEREKLISSVRSAIQMSVSMGDWARMSKLGKYAEQPTSTPDPKPEPSTPAPDPKPEPSTPAPDPEPEQPTPAPDPESEQPTPEGESKPQTVLERKTAVSKWLQSMGFVTPKQKSNFLNWLLTDEENITMSKLNHSHLRVIERFMELTQERNTEILGQMISPVIAKGTEPVKWLEYEGLLQSSTPEPDTTDDHAPEPIESDAVFAEDAPF